MGKNDKSSALADTVSDWGKWTITQEDDGEFVLKSHRGTYLMGKDSKSTELAEINDWAEPFQQAVLKEFDSFLEELA